MASRPLARGPAATLIAFLVNVLLLSPPSSLADFQERPTNTSVLLGQDVTLRCSAKKDPSSYELYSQWRINTGALLGFHEAGTLSGHQGRYSYVKDSPDDLHLRVERVSLEDDGMFECQMLRPDSSPFRAAAHLEVVVPPQTASFTNYRSGSVLEIVEGSPLNITCTSPNAKPAPELTWYMSGRRIADDIDKFATYNLNKTASAFSSLSWKPRREDDGKILTCEAQHEKSGATVLRANVTLNVLYPSDQPVVSVVGGETFVKFGDNVTLLCVVRGGNPPPTVAWYSSGKSVDALYEYDATSQETRNTYSFIASSDDNQSPHECRSQNREGATPMVNSIHVSVVYAPQGVEMYGETSIRHGAVTSIQCRSKPANPPAQITWLVNGHPLAGAVQSEHKAASGTIAISNLTVNSNEATNSKHMIVIECNAKNNEGTATRQHVLKILAPPLPPRISGLEDTMHAEGEQLNISCEAHGGNPLPEITWFKGYDKISGARSSISGDTVISTVQLTLDRSMNNQGVKCEAMNSALDEPLQDARQLSVLYPPRRLSIRTPENSRHQLIAGKESRLVCSAPDSNPPADLHWEFHPNGEAAPLVLKGDTIRNETRPGSGHTVENEIAFMPTDKYDGTLVRCIASHPTWPDTRNVTLPLNVYYAPRLLVDSPISVVVSEGDSFRENLTVLANPPVSAWRWRKNGVPFDQTVGGIFARGAMLSGRSLKESDAGTYTLYAVNNVGTANVSFQLIIEFAAKITHITSPVIASVGEDVALECVADGMPKRPDMIKWTRKGHEVTSEKRGDARATLRLKAAHDVAGKYVCVAFNGIGEPVETAAYLLVNRAPQIIHVPSLSRAAGPLGGKARLRCRAHAVPDAEFAWFRGGEQIRANNSKFALHTSQLDYSTFESTLWISSLGPDDYTREVKCTAFNRMGEDSYIVPVGPLAPPEVPLHVHTTNSTPDAISLAWTPGFDGGAEQIFELRYQREGDHKIYTVNTTRPHVKLAGLIAATTYLFQLRSLNARGFSSDFTRPPQRFSTLTEEGVSIENVNSKTSGWMSLANLMPYLLVVASVLVILNLLLIYYILKKHRRKKIIQVHFYADPPEKTEIVRSTANGADGLRSMQMYGAIDACGGGGGLPPSTACLLTRPGSGAGGDISSRAEDFHGTGSEDEHSVRTMIEVNPNGYMQQIDPAYYERACLVELDMDPRGYSSRDAMLQTGTYANMPYPEPPQDVASLYADRSLTRRGYMPMNGTLLSNHSSSAGGSSSYAKVNNNNQGQLSSNNNTLLRSAPGTPNQQQRHQQQHMLSTFIQQPNGVRAGSLRYSQQDGDLV